MQGDHPHENRAALALSIPHILQTVVDALSDKEAFRCSIVCLSWWPVAISTSWQGRQPDDLINVCVKRSLFKDVEDLGEWQKALSEVSSETWERCRMYGKLIKRFRLLFFRYNDTRIFEAWIDQSPWTAALPLLPNLTSLLICSRREFTNSHSLHKLLAADSASMIKSLHLIQMYKDPHYRGTLLTFFAPFVRSITSLRIHSAGPIYLNEDILSHSNWAAALGQLQSLGLSRLFEFELLTTVSFSALTSLSIKDFAMLERFKRAASQFPRLQKVTINNDNPEPLTNSSLMEPFSTVKELVLGPYYEFDTLASCVVIGTTFPNVSKLWIHTRLNYGPNAQQTPQPNPQLVLQALAPLSRLISLSIISPSFKTVTVSDIFDALNLWPRLEEFQIWNSVYPASFDVISTACSQHPNLKRLALRYLSDSSTSIDLPPPDKQDNSNIALEQLILFNEEVVSKLDQQNISSRLHNDGIPLRCQVLFCTPQELQCVA